jgi:hypothetical protein
MRGSSHRDPTTPARRGRSLDVTDRFGCGPVYVPLALHPSKPGGSPGHSSLRPNAKLIPLLYSATHALEDFVLLRTMTFWRHCRCGT